MIGGWTGCKQGGKTGGGGQKSGGQLVENKKIQESIIGERVNLRALGGGGVYVNFTQLQVVTKRKSNSGDARLF